MAPIPFKLPDIGEGIHEGEIVKWHVHAGAEVAEDDPMVEVTTDKATVTISAPRAARVVELLVAERETARVGDPLLLLDALDAGSGERRAEASALAEGRGADRREGPVASAVGDIRESVPGADVYRARRASGGGRHGRRKTLAAPATRKRARELGIDLADVPGSGPEGRVTRADLDRATRRPGAPPPRDDERRQVPGPRRRAIAAKMVESRERAVQLSLVEECDFGALVSLRARIASAAEDRGVRLTYLPFVAKAVAATLREHPELNARFDDSTGELVLHGRVDLGVATADDDGLLVPVVRDVGRRSLLGCAKEIARLAESARAGALEASELTGSTFTLTSLGKLGGLFATPILNPPELGILGVHRVRDRPVVRGGEIVIAPIAHLSLSFDHRFIDGELAARFLYAVIERLEAPETLLLELGEP